MLAILYPSITFPISSIFRLEGNIGRRGREEGETEEEGEEGGEGDKEAEERKKNGH
jgi:hypothetical protein